MKPKTVSLMIGSNNMTNNPNDQTAGYVKQIIQEIKQRSPNTNIILNGVLPRQEVGYNKDAQVAPLNQMLSKLGNNKDVRFVDFSRYFRKPDGSINSSLYLDNIHPNNQGYKVWGDVLRGQLNKK